MTTMKAIQIHEFGNTSVLKYEDVERPEPLVGEVLVRVRAAGINPIDTFSREHPLPLTTGKARLPYILGWDVSGEIASLFDDGQLKVAIDAVFPLQDVALAHKLSEGGHVRGKLVLSVE